MIRSALSSSPQHALLAAVRRAAADSAWKDEYRRWRPPVERAIAWLAARGSRRVPYRGITSNRLPDVTVVADAGTVR